MSVSVVSQKKAMVFSHVTSAFVDCPQLPELAGFITAVFGQGLNNTFHDFV